MADRNMIAEGNESALGSDMLVRLGLLASGILHVSQVSLNVIGCTGFRDAIQATVAG